MKKICLIILLFGTIAQAQSVGEQYADALIKHNDSIFNGLLKKGWEKHQAAFYTFRNYGDLVTSEIRLMNYHEIKKRHKKRGGDMVVLYGGVNRPFYGTDWYNGDNFIEYIDKRTTPRNIESYVDIFFEDIRKMGGEISNTWFRNFSWKMAELNILYGNVKIEYVNFPDNKIASAYRDGCDIILKVDAGKWINLSTLHRAWLIWHELGHGVFLLNHNPELDIMFPYLPGMELTNEYFFESRAELLNYMMIAPDGQSDENWLNKIICKNRNL